MMKFLPYAVLLVVHFVVSLVCNWVLGGSANMIQALLSSVVFISICPAVFRFLAKRKREH